MTHRTYRRLMFTVIMLLTAVSLIKSPTPTSAVMETCEECNAVCDEIQYGCLEHGYPSHYCASLARPCRIDCFYGGRGVFPRYDLCVDLSVIGAPKWSRSDFTSKELTSPQTTFVARAVDADKLCSAGLVLSAGVRVKRKPVITAAFVITW